MCQKKTVIILLLIMLNSLNNQVSWANSFFSDSEEFNKKIFEQSDSVYRPQYLIPVKFWFIIKNSCQKEKLRQYAKEQIHYLNKYYSSNKTGIAFYQHPEIRFIEKKKLYVLNYYKEAPFQALKRHSKYCLNVIVVKELIKEKFLNSPRKKKAGSYNPLFKTVIITQNTSSSTLSHEVGHYLGLYHPHRAWKYRWFQEPVSRTKKRVGSNVLVCKRKGDKVCDTPAEPNLNKYTDNNCNYTGWNVTDKYGTVYKPNTDNIMSYTRNRECRKKFTKGQIARMHHSLAKNKYAKYWRTDNEKNRIFSPDIYEPNNTAETAGQIFENEKQTHSFYPTFAKRKKNIGKDRKDYIFFNIEAEKAENILLISGAKGTQPNIKIQIFYQDTLILKKSLHLDAHAQTINIPKKAPGKYTIYIEETGNSIEKKFYTLSLK